MPFIVALLLGLRHATDPDHLTAVSTLILGHDRNGPRRAGVLGLAWGAGHATTLFACGLPVILFGHSLPTNVRQLAEASIGLIIVFLSARLLIRWRSGYFHGHPHTHGSIRHAHPHVHEQRHNPGSSPEHAHAHADALGRTPLASYGIGLVHGVGGSAGASVLLMGTVAGTSRAALLLLVFAGATGLSMALLSTGFAYVLNRATIRVRLAELVPLFGAAGVLFGVWYSLGALWAGGV
jgi:cytochrome c biogenesis protein CcdA